MLRRVAQASNNEPPNFYGYMRGVGDEAGAHLWARRDKLATGAVALCAHCVNVKAGVVVHQPRGNIEFLVGVAIVRGQAAAVLKRDA